MSYVYAFLAGMFVGALIYAFRRPLRTAAQKEIDKLAKEKKSPS